MNLWPILTVANTAQNGILAVTLQASIQHWLQAEDAKGTGHIWRYYAPSGDYQKRDRSEEHETKYSKTKGVRALVLQGVFYRAKSKQQLRYQ